MSDDSSVSIRRPHSSRAHTRVCAQRRVLYYYVYGNTYKNAYVQGGTVKQKKKKLRRHEELFVISTNRFLSSWPFCNTCFFPTERFPKTPDGRRTYFVFEAQESPEIPQLFLRAPLYNNKSRVETRLRADKKKKNRTMSSTAVSSYIRASTLLRLSFFTDKSK